MNRAVKAVLALLLAVLVIWLLFTIVFPWFDRTFITDPTLEAAPAGVGAFG